MFGKCFRTGIVLALLGVAACASNPPIRSTARVQVLTAQTLPAPERSDLLAPDRPSLIGPLDTLLVDVFNVPDLTREVQVDASGRITLPLVGVVDVNGKTASEIADLIKLRLRQRYVRNPEVTVNIKGSASQLVVVDGEVREPGMYPITNQMTLMRAIASAKGTSEFAKLDDVVILRTVNGQRLAGLYNLTAIRRGVYDDPYVYANDVVVVGDSPSRRMFKDIISVAPLFVAPIVALIQR